MSIIATTTTNTDKNTVCSDYDHNKKSSLTEEWNKLYCIGNRYLSGATCIDCNKKFSNIKTDDNCFVPSTREPAYVCYNFKKLKGCNYAVCHGCYMEKADDGKDERKRRKRNQDD